MSAATTTAVEWRLHRTFDLESAAVRAATGEDVCAGRLHLHDASGPFLLAECDGCGYEVAVPRRLTVPRERPDRWWDR